MTAQKPGLHPRNRHRSRYDMNALCLSCPPLQDYLVQTPAGDPRSTLLTRRRLKC